MGVLASLQAFLPQEELRRKISSNRVDSSLNIDSHLSRDGVRMQAHQSCIGTYRGPRFSHGGLASRRDVHPGVAASASVATGILVASSLPPWNLHAVAAVALAPLLAVVRRSRVASATLCGGLAGCVAACAIAFWLPGVLYQRTGSVPWAIAGWVFVAGAATGLSLALFGLVLAGWRELRPWSFVLAAAAAMWGVDWGRSVVGTGIPWGLLGHAAWEWPGVAQLAALGGVPAVSSLLTVTAAGLAVVTEDRRRGLAAFLAGTGALLALGLTGDLAVESLHHVATVRPPDVVLVQPYTPFAERWISVLEREQAEHALALTREALASAPADAVVLWPETSLTTPFGASPASQEVLAYFARIHRTAAIGAVTAASQRTRYRNSILLLRGGSVREQFDKTLPLPLFEADPGGPVGALVASLLQPLVVGRKVEPGSREAGLEGGAWIPVVCWEALWPGIVSGRRGPGASMIVSFSNAAWAPGSAPGEQMLAAVVFRAIEQRLPLVHIAHGGPSAAVDALGRPVAELPVNRASFGSASLEPGFVPTSLDAWVLCALAVGGALPGLLLGILWR